MENKITTSNSVSLELRLGIEPRIRRIIQMAFIGSILMASTLTVDSFAQVRLVADLNTGKKDPTVSKPFSQHESDGGQAYFIGETNELWTSDGTTAGTKFIKAFLDIKEIEVIGDDCFLSARMDDRGYELWKSDGTAGGTIRVKDIYPGNGSSTPLFLTRLDGVLYFSANNGGNNRELWKSDGTSGGTVLVKDIYPGNEGSKPSTLVAAEDKLFFVATTPSPGYELWVSDGTSSGTRLVKDINPGAAGSSISDLIESGGDVYFSAQSPSRGRQLWKSDGTGTGTSIVKVINAEGSAGVSDLIDVDGVVFFRATDGVSGMELFRTDGTPAGTFKLTDLGLSLTSFSEVNGKLFFTSYESANPSLNRSIWMSDGTIPGTIQITSPEMFPELSVSLSQTYHEINGAAYFFGSDQNTAQGNFYRISMNGSLSVVKEVPWTEESIAIVETGTLHYFLSDGYYWRTDGTSGGTYRLRTLCCGEGSRPLFLEDGGGKLYFSTTNPEAFWRTEGTAESTDLLEMDFVEEMESLNGDMFYRLGDSFGPESSVWVVDGETGAKTQVSSLATDPRFLTKAGDRIYFAANTSLDQRRLWVSDGTTTGTRAIDVGPAPGFIAALGNKAVFNSNRELWVSDGTNAGSQLLLNVQSGPQYLAEFKGSLYFYASDGTHGLELWKTDGTPSGTIMMKDIRQNDTGSQSFQDLNGVAVTEDWLYFAAINSQGKHSIWRTDGTGTNTTEVFALEPATRDLPSLIGPAGSNVFFIRILESGSEIWAYNGTTFKKIKTLDQPYQYINAVDGSVMYMITFGAQRNGEIWRSDGTIEGTYQIKFRGIPYALETSGDYVYLAGRADKEGSELFVIEESASTSNKVVAGNTRSDVIFEDDVVSSYPSPFNNAFTLRVSGDENAMFSLEVVAMDGMRLKDEELPYNKAHQIGSPAWSDGVYLLRIKTGSRVVTRKVVKVSR